MNRDKASGILIFVGVSQFLIFMIIAESLYPHYTIYGNYISDLGVGNTAIIFNTSILILGVLLIVGGSLLESRVLRAFLIIAGIGAAGVGVFPETSPHHLHTIFALIVFLFASISSYPAFTYKKGRMPLWPIMGSISLASLIMYILNFYGPIGYGGMERMIVYADMLWALGFSGWLMKDRR